MKKFLAKFLLMVIIISSIQSKGLIEVQAAQGPIVEITTPSKVLLGGGTTSQTARPQVLSNGWIVVASMNNTGVVYFSVSKDQGISFSELCRSSTGVAGGSFSMVSYGTIIYLLSENTTQMQVDQFDATTQANIDISTIGRKSFSTETSIETSIDTCSLAVNPSNGQLTATWTSKNASYPGSFNIRSVKSVDGLLTYSKQNGTVGIDQISVLNTTGQNYKNPVVAYMNNNQPIIIYDYNYSTTSNNIGAYYYNGTAWTNVTIATNNGYVQSSPSVAVQKYGDYIGRIYVAWQGKDSTAISVNNIKCKYSDDNGITWTNAGTTNAGITNEKITVGNTKDQMNPSLTINKDGSVFLTWQGMESPGYDIKTISRTDNTWGIIQTKTNSTMGDISTPISCDNYYDFEQPLIIWTDSQIIEDKSVLNFNGTNGSNAFLDASGKVWTAYGDTKTSTNQSKFGESSGFFDGTGDYISTPTNSDLNLEQANFTIDLFIKKSIQNTNMYISGQASSTAQEGSFCLYSKDDNKIHASIMSGTTEYSILSTGTITDANWHHIALVRNGGKLELFIDGISNGLTDVQNITVNNSLYKLSIGRYGEKDAQYFNGYMDDFRITKGLARWTSNFTVPLSTSVYTKLSPSIDFVGTWSYLNVMTPEINIETTANNQLKLLVSDSNSTETQYQISCNNQFINELGEISVEPVWMTLADKGLVLEKLAYNVPYSFKVKARNKENIETEFSTVKTATLVIQLPAAPSNFSSSVNQDTVTLNWDDVAATLYYEVEIDGEIITNISDHTYVHKRLEINSDHMYKVRAVSEFGKGAWTSYTLVTIDQGIPSVPQNIQAKIEDVSATISWDSIFGAEEYGIEINGLIDNELFPELEQEFYQLVSEQNYYKLYQLKPNTTYTYKVYAINSIGSSEMSEVKTFTTFALPAPKVLTGVVTETSIETNWNAITGASSYEMKVDGQIINVGAALTYTHADLLAYTAHTYQVRALKADGTTSAWSEEMPISSLPKRPDAPKNFIATATDTAIQLIWNLLDEYELNEENLMNELAILFSSGISIDYEIDGVVIEGEGVGAITGYLHTELDPSTAHSYRMRLRTGLIEGFWSDYIYISTLPGKAKAPVDISISTIGTVSTIKWEAITGITGYDIEIDGTIYKVGELTSFIHRGVALGQEHTYRVRSTNSIGTSEWSGLVVNNSIKAKSNKNKDLNLGLTASHITDFSKYELTVYYNKDVLKVTDLCAKTTAKELTTGLIKDQGITITEFKEGQITFVVDKKIEPGYDWTGIINNIVFKGKLSGGTTIDYTATIISE